MSILDGFIRGSRQASNYYDSLNRRELANNADARDERRLVLSENQDKRLGAQETRAAAKEEDDNRKRDAEFGDTQLERRSRDASSIYSNMLADGYTQVDDQGHVGLSDSYKTRLLDGDEFAQGYFLQKLNFAKRDFLPAEFNVDRINQTVDPETGEKLYVVGGSYGDGRGGVLTESGASDDSAAAKMFTEQELFGLARTAFRGTGGILQTQSQKYGGYDRTAYRNAINLGQTQGAIFDNLKSNPAAQRQAQAVIGSAETPAEEIQLTNQLAADVGVEPFEKEEATGADSEQSTAPTDNSAQIAKLEKELAAIEGRKTGKSRANVRAAERKRAEIQRLKDESEPQEPSRGVSGRVLAGQKRAQNRNPLPPIVEQQVAPVVDGKTLDEIDEAIDSGELQINQETAAAAAQDLQEQGVETAADLAKLDPRRQAFAYAMIIASTPNDGNRIAVQKQLINILETGSSDRGASSVALQNAQSTAMNAETSRGRLVFDAKKYTEGISDGYRETANELFEEIQDVIYPMDSETGQADRARLNSQSANTLANRVMPKLRRQKAELLRNGSPADIKSIQALMNQTLSFMVQSLANDTDPGIVDSFLNFFNPKAKGNFDGDLSNIYKRDGKYVYGQLNRDGTVRPEGNPISAGQLKALNVNLFPVIDAAATENEERASKLRAGSD